MTANAAVIEQLFAHYRDDREAVDMICGAMDTFERYHKAIIALEFRRKLYVLGALSAEEYREQIPPLDKARTSAHNAVLSQVNILNRLARQAGLPPFYDGTVSEERPYRREVANAVLDYLEDIIRSRG